MGERVLTTDLHKLSIDTSHPWEASPRDNIGTVSFLDNLLGSQALSSPGAFVGFDNPTGLIGAALIADTGANASVVTVDNLQVPARSRAPALPLFVTGLGMMALLAWRRKRKGVAET